jgi:hypothetical protein
MDTVETIHDVQVEAEFYIYVYGFCFLFTKLLASIHPAIASQSHPNAQVFYAHGPERTISPIAHFCMWSEESDKQLWETKEIYVDYTRAALWNPYFTNVCNKILSFHKLIQ